MLTQLPKSGDWVTLTEITNVEASAGAGPNVPPYVGYTESGLFKNIPCDSFEDARRLRNEIAAMVNAALAEQRDETGAAAGPEA